MTDNLIIIGFDSESVARAGATLPGHSTQDRLSRHLLRGGQDGAHRSALVW